MKLRIIYTLFSLATGLFLWMGNSGGAAAVQNQDRTNGPAAMGFCGNSFCHDDGSFSPTLEIQLLDAGSPVTNYVPGQTYTLSVTITATSGTPAEYGFQAVALDASDLNTGTFGTPASGQQITSIGNGNQYWEHAGAQLENQFEIEWTAPMDATAGEITFYSAGIAANDGNGNGGDGAASSQLSVQPMASSIFQIATLPIEVQVYPNPVKDVANVAINSDKHSTVNLNIFDVHGRLVQQQNTDLQVGDNQFSVEMNDLATGIYHLQVTDGERIKSLKILKK